MFGFQVIWGVVCSRCESAARLELMNTLDVQSKWLIVPVNIPVLRPQGKPTVQKHISSWITMRSQREGECVVDEVLINLSLSLYLSTSLALPTYLPLSPYLPTFLSSSPHLPLSLPSPCYRWEDYTPEEMALAVVKKEPLLFGSPSSPPCQPHSPVSRSKSLRSVLTKSIWLVAY